MKRKIFLPILMATMIMSTMMMGCGAEADPSGTTEGGAEQSVEVYNLGPDSQTGTDTGSETGVDTVIDSGAADESKEDDTPEASILSSSEDDSEADSSSSDSSEGVGAGLFTTN